MLKAHGAYFRENGIPGFLTPDGYDFCWLQYQGMLVEKLNQLTFGTVEDVASITVDIMADKLAFLRDGQ